MVRVVVHLATLHDRDLVVEELDEVADQAGLRLPPLAEQDDVVAGEDPPLEPGQDGAPVANDRAEELLSPVQPFDEVVAQLLLDGAVGVAGRAELAQGGGSVFWARSARPGGLAGAQPGALEVLTGRMLGAALHHRLLARAARESRMALHLLELHGCLEALEEPAQPADEAGVGDPDLLAGGAVPEGERQVDGLQLVAEHIGEALQDLVGHPLMERGELGGRGLVGIHLADLLEHGPDDPREAQQLFGIKGPVVLRTLLPVARGDLGNGAGAAGIGENQMRLLVRHAGQRTRSSGQRRRRVAAPGPNVREMFT